MAPPTPEEKGLGGMPTEVVDMICDELSPRDKASLSETDRHLRKSAVKSLFKSATINTRDFSRVRSFIRAAARHGGEVQELRIIVPAATCNDPLTCRKCSPLQTSTWRARDDVLALLRGDHDAMLPNLSAITLEFPAKFGNHRMEWEEFELPFEWAVTGEEDDDSELEWTETDMEDDDSGLEGTAIDGEDGHTDNRHPWYGIHERVHTWINAAFTALSHRPSRSITYLAIDNFPSIEDSVIAPWSTSGWKALLGGLERFDLSLWAGDDDGGLLHMWQQHTDIDAWDYLAEYFFDHLAIVKHIRFEGSLNSAIGYKDGYIGHVDLPLISDWNSPPNTLPLLESLELVKIMVDKPLLQFIETRAGKAPLALTLENTWAYRPREDGCWGDESPKWVEMFDSLTSMITREGGPRLSMFKLTPREKCFWTRRKEPWTLPYRYAHIGYGDDIGVPGEQLLYDDADLDAEYGSVDKEWGLNVKAERRLMKEVARFNGQRRGQGASEEAKQLA